MLNPVTTEAFIVWLAVHALRFKSQLLIHLYFCALCTYHKPMVPVITDGSLN